MNITDCAATGSTVSASHMLLLAAVVISPVVVGVWVGVSALRRHVWLYRQCLRLRAERDQARRLWRELTAESVDWKGHRDRLLGALRLAALPAKARRLLDGGTPPSPTGLGGGE